MIGEPRGESKTIEMTRVPSTDDEHAISTPIDGILRLQEGGTALAGTTINIGRGLILTKSFVPDKVW